MRALQNAQARGSQGRGSGLSRFELHLGERMARECKSCALEFISWSDITGLRNQFGDCLLYLASGPGLLRSPRCA